MFFSKFPTSDHRHFYRGIPRGIGIEWFQLPIEAIIMRVKTKVLVIKLRNIAASSTGFSVILHLSVVRLCLNHGNRQTLLDFPVDLKRNTGVFHQGSKYVEETENQKPLNGLHVRHLGERRPGTVGERCHSENCCDPEGYAC